MRILDCQSVFPGIAICPVFLFRQRNSMEIKPVDSDPVMEEKRLDDAVRAVETRLGEACARSGRSDGILAAQQMMLEDGADDALVPRIRKMIRAEHKNAEYCAARAGEQLAKEFENMDSAYLQARSEDVLSLARSIASALGKVENGKGLTEMSIVVAEELSPEDIAFFDRKLVCGIVTRKGSPVSHTAIFAGNAGIPYATGLEEAEIPDGIPAALDAEKGKLILEPDKKTIRDLEARREEMLREAASHSIADCPVKLFANIGSAEDAKAAREAGAMGIGLFRTEALYLSRDTAPDEEEQYGIYKAVLETMRDKPVIIRTIDIGADKKAKCVALPEEENPALGTRGIRISFANPVLFRTQLRALLRAAVYGDLRIMYPMITSCEEVDDIFAEVKKTAEELTREGIAFRVPKQGIMIETPAAALTSDALAARVDFFSVGTNDLTQYTLALDRLAEGMGRYYRPHHEAILSLIRMSCESAHRHGIPIGICGEAGSDPALLPHFVEMGIDELSMSASKLARTAAAIAGIAKAAAPAEKSYVPEAIVSPADGEIVPQEEIPDETFAQGVLGDCVGIDPEAGDIYSPCNGEIVSVAPTCHAIGIRSTGGQEYLIHIGIDTVKMGGKGFECDLKPGMKVEKGQYLMKFDPDEVIRQGYSPIVVLIRLKTA